MLATVKVIPFAVPRPVVDEALALHPAAKWVFAAYHLGGCSDCASSSDETLAEVAELLDLRLDPGHTADDVRERARVKIEMTKAKIRDLRRIQAALERLVNACDAHGPPEECALMRAIGADANF